MFEEYDLDPKTFFAVANADRSCSAGETLYAQGDAADAVFYIHSGEIKLVVTSEESPPSRGSTCRNRSGRSGGHGPRRP